MTEFYVVTASARTKALPAVAASIAYAKKPGSLNIHWHVSMSQEDDPYGVRQWNEMFNSFNDGWVWSLSDDNLVHRDFFMEVEVAIEAHPDAKVIVFSEHRMDRTGDLIAAPDNVRPCRIDGAQYILNMQSGIPFEWSLERHGKQCDGYYIEELFKEYGDSFVFIDKKVVNFNALYWLDKENE